MDYACVLHVEMQSSAYLDYSAIKIQIVFSKKETEARHQDRQGRTV